MREEVDIHSGRRKIRIGLGVYASCCWQCTLLDCENPCSYKCGECDKFFCAHFRMSGIRKTERRSFLNFKNQVKQKLNEVECIRVKKDEVVDMVGGGEKSSYKEVLKALKEHYKVGEDEDYLYLCRR